MLLGLPALSLVSGITLHLLVPPFPDLRIPPPRLESWLVLPVMPINIWQGELPGYRLDQVLREPPCLSEEDILKKIMSSEPVTINNSCELTNGTWIDSWSGRRITNPARVHIIETVPIRWLTGSFKAKGETDGEGWSPAELAELMTLTPENVERLMTTSGRGANRRGNLPIDRFKPWRETSTCRYAFRWARVKLHYRLPISQEERDVVADLLRDCR